METSPVPRFQLNHFELQNWGCEPRAFLAALQCYLTLCSIVYCLVSL